jgi:hypothetical protein
VKDPTASALRLPGRQSTFTVYRAGPLTKARHYGPHQKLFAEADRLKPPGRPGRLDGLFCIVENDPDHLRRLGNNLIRWHRGEIPIAAARLVCAGPLPYVYSSSAWTQAQHLFKQYREFLGYREHTDKGDEDDRFQDHHPSNEGAARLWDNCGHALRSYWERGVPLDDFHAGRHDFNTQYDTVEAIILPEQILEVEPQPVASLIQRDRLRDLQAGYYGVEALAAHGAS